MPLARLQAEDAAMRPQWLVKHTSIENGCKTMVRLLMPVSGEGVAFFHSFFFLPSSFHVFSWPADVFFLEF